MDQFPFTLTEFSWPGIQSPCLYEDGFITSTFGVQGSMRIYSSLLKMPAHAVTPIYCSNGHAQWQAEVLLHARTPARVVLDYVVPPSIGPVIPQRLWRPQSDKLLSSLVHNGALCWPIFFVRRDFEGIGITLEEATHRQHHCLHSYDALVDFGGKTTTSLRILWSGYEEFSRQIQLKDQTRSRNPITLGRWAQYVATTVSRFIEDPPALLNEHDRQPQWAIGDGRITARDIILVGVVHTSAGTWQPILQLVSRT